MPLLEVLNLPLHCVQESPNIGTHIDEAVSYIVSFTGQTTLQFTDVVCDSFTDRCSLSVDGSRLSNDERYLIAVIALNAIGHGSSTFFPNQSEFNI